MSKKDINILFIGHDATLTGAPLLLLELLRWIKSRTALKTSLLLWSDGPLKKEFEAVLPTTVATKSRLSRVRASLNISSHISYILKRDDLLAGTTIVYANTVACAKVLPLIAGSNRQIIHHIHELEFATKKLGMFEQMRKNISITDKYIAASEAVAEFLHLRVGVPKSKIQVIHEFPINVPCHKEKLDTRTRIRLKLGLREDQILILMSGTPELRKGTDLFVRMAAVATKNRDNDRLRFLWLGGNSQQLARFQRLAKKLNVQGICQFVSSVERPQDWLTAADVFSLTSREDPCSVVMLEAAMTAMPIVCFAGAGGGPELVQTDAGYVIAQFDLNAMANACIRLAEDEGLRRRMGEAARARVENNYQLDRQAAVIMEVLRNLDVA